MNIDISTIISIIVAICLITVSIICYHNSRKE